MSRELLQVGKKRKHFNTRIKLDNKTILSLRYIFTMAGIILISIEINIVWKKKVVLTVKICNIFIILFFKS